MKQCEGKFDASGRLLSLHSCGIWSPGSLLGKLVRHRYFRARVAFPSLLAPNICVLSVRVGRAVLGFRKQLLCRAISDYGATFHTPPRLRGRVFGLTCSGGGMRSKPLRQPRSPVLNADSSYANVSRCHGSQVSCQTFFPLAVLGLYVCLSVCLSACCPSSSSRFVGQHSSLTQPRKNVVKTDSKDLLRVIYGMLPSSQSPSSLVLRAFLVINGMFPSKGWECTLVSGHTCCISENHFTVWAPLSGKSQSQNWALGEGVRKVERRGTLRGVCMNLSCGCVCV